MLLKHWLLKKALASSNTQKWAASIARNSRDPKVLDLLLDALKGNYLTMEVPMAIASIGDKRAIEPLREALEHRILGPGMGIAVALVTLGEVRGFHWLWSEFLDELGRDCLPWATPVLSRLAPLWWEVVGSDELSKIASLTDEQLARVTAAEREGIHALRETALHHLERARYQPPISPGA